MNLFLMFFTTFLIQLIISMEMNLIGPMAPFLAQYFGIKASSVVLFNIGFSLIGLLVPFLGAFADKYGKKKSLMISLLFYIGGTLISGFTTNPIVFAFGRVFIGIGYFSISGANLSYLSEFVPYKSRGKASGSLRIAFAFAILFSPLYGSFMISKYNNLASIYIPFTVIGIICFLILLTLPETAKNKDAKIHKEELINVLKIPINYKSLSVLFFMLATPSLLLGFLAVYLTSSFSLTQVEIGYAYTIVAVGSTLGITFATFFTDKIGKEKLSRILFTIVLISLIPLAFLKSIYLVVGFLALVTFGLDGGWTSYQTLCSEINPKQRGLFMSLFYATNAFTVTIYSILGPILYNLGGYLLLIIIAIIGTAIALKILYSLSIENYIEKQERKLL